MSNVSIPGQRRRQWPSIKPILCIRYGQLKPLNNSCNSIQTQNVESIALHDEGSRFNPFKPDFTLSSSSTTSRELLSQFTTCSRCRWFDVVGEKVKKIAISFMEIFILKPFVVGFKSVLRDVKWCFNASWELKGLKHHGNYCRRGSIPANTCWLNAGPASKTVNQHCVGIWWISRVCWDGALVSCPVVIYHAFKWS